jgi:hypothetical protein
MTMSTWPVIPAQKHVSALEQPTLRFVPVDATARDTMRQQLMDTRNCWGFPLHPRQTQPRDTTIQERERRNSDTRPAPNRNAHDLQLCKASGCFPSSEHLAAAQATRASTRSTQRDSQATQCDSSRWTRESAGGFLCMVSVQRIRATIVNAKPLELGRRLR